MEQFLDFLHMNGYNYYIWPAFGISALILLTIIIHSHRSLDRSQSQLKELLDKDTISDTKNDSRDET